MTAQTQNLNEQPPTTITGVFTSDDSFGKTALESLFAEVQNQKLTPSQAGSTFRFTKIDPKQHSAGLEIFAARPDQQIKVIHAALLVLKGGSYKNWAEGRVCHAVLSSLLRRKLPLRQDDVEQFLSLLIREMKIYPISELPTLPIVSQVAKFIEKRGITKKTRQQLQQLKKVYHRKADDAPTRKIGDRIETILETVLGSQRAAEREVNHLSESRRSI